MHPPGYELHGYLTQRMRARVRCEVALAGEPVTAIVMLLISLGFSGYRIGNRLVTR
jgi:hypothetical protein